MAEVLLRIIEELADGFLVINEEGKIVFFNEVFLTTTGLRSNDILAHEGEFLTDLRRGDKGTGQERETVIRDMHGTPHRFMVSSLNVESTRGQCTLVRLSAIHNGTCAPARDSAELRQMFRNIRDPLYTADLGGTISVANPAFYALLEWKEDEPLPNVADLYPSASELEDKILRLAEEDSVSNLETHLRTRSQRPIRVLDTSWVLRDDKGIATGYTTHLKDVTQVKNLEARLKISERNYILLFGTIFSSIIIVDRAGQILNCNFSAETLFGYPWMDIVGKNYSDVFQVPERPASPESPPGSVHTARPSIKDIIAIVDRNRGHYIETDVPRQCRDGTIKFTYASYSALTSTTGETIAYAVMERDLTEREQREKRLEESFQQIKETQSGTILGFARLTEYRDMDSGRHLERIRDYTRVLAQGLSELPKYAGYITAEYIEDVCLASILHDVGKVGIEDAVLRKSGRLTFEEFETMKEHARLGGEALKAVDREINRESFLTIGKEIAFSHHERWDGTGYPRGIAGEQIPLSARIVALADVYDALTSKRSYKDAIPHDEAVKIIMSESGTHFDPDVAEVFMKNRDTFQRIQAFDSNPLNVGDLPKASSPPRIRHGRGSGA